MLQIPALFRVNRTIAYKEMSLFLPSYGSMLIDYGLTPLLPTTLRCFLPLFYLATLHCIFYLALMHHTCAGYPLIGLFFIPERSTEVSQKFESASICFAMILRSLFLEVNVQLSRYVPIWTAIVGKESRNSNFCRAMSRYAF